MARVLIFSQNYPSYHPRGLKRDNIGNVFQSEPTFFVEKFLNSIGIDWESSNYLDMVDKLNPHLKEEVISNFFVGLGLEHPIYECLKQKIHTIRAGNRWEEGDLFSPRVWSGKPYASPQITFAPNQEVVKTYGFRIKDYSGVNYMDIENRYHITDDCFEMSILPMIARNDGLTMDDLLNWFKWPKPFVGQVICWSDPKY